MRAFLGATCVALAACAEARGGEDAREPANVLLVVLDDVGVDLVGAYTPGAAHTPRLDALAARGVRFTNAWGAPFCEPARAAFETGRYGFRTGVGSVGKGGLPLEEVTLAEMLELGTGGRYATAAIGKWHLAGARNGGLESPNRAGYDHFAGTLGNLDDYFDYRRVTDGTSERRAGYATTDQVHDALTWIREAPEPWFCHVAFNAAHRPLHAPPPRLHGVRFPTEGPEAIASAMFDAMVEALDRELANLVEGIAPEVRSRTTILVVSDNGTNRHHLPEEDVAGDPDAGKGTVTQSGIRVPLVVVGPTVAAPGRTVDALVDATDLFATIADLAGADLERVRPALAGPLDSRSFARLLRSADAAASAPPAADRDATGARTFAFAETFRPNGAGPYAVTRRALRDERYKLVALRRANGETSEHLFDLREDPDETRDLLARAPDDPAVTAARERLRTELDRLLASDG